MSGRIAVVAVAGAVAVGGLAGVAIPHLVHTELSLLSADGPLSGSDAAVVLGATFIPNPSDQYAQSAEDLYLHPLGFDGGATDSAVCHMDGTDPCSAPLQVLSTPETLQWDQSMSTGAADVTQAIEHEFADHPGAFSAEHPLTVFAYSQGASDSSIAMTQLAQDGIPSDAVHFVFIGDPNDELGMLPNLEYDLNQLVGPFVTDVLLRLVDVQDVVAGNPGTPTPADLYPVTNYTLDGDGFADFQPDYESGGISSVVSGIVHQHIEYLGLTAQQIADATTTTDGEITQIDISHADVSNVTALAHALAGMGLGTDAQAFVNLVDDFANEIGLLFKDGIGLL